MSPPKNSGKTTTTKHPADDGASAVGAPNKRARRGQASDSRESTESTLDGPVGEELDTVTTEQPSAGVDSSKRPDTEDVDANAVPPPSQMGGMDVPGQAPSTTGHEQSSAAPDQSTGGDVGPDTRVTFKRRPWFSNDLMKRIPPMLLYNLPADHMFSLSSLPMDNLDWGRSSSSSAKLCLAGGCVPVTIWVIGIIDSLWLFDRKGDAEERISVGVVPLTDHAMVAARNLLAHHSRPVAAISSMLTHVSASRWMSLRIGGERAPQILEFDKVYDARARYGAKPTMPPYPAESLKRGDLVLMEAQISRYNSAAKPGGSSKFSKNLKPSDFVQWKATFDLVAVSLLEIGPKLIEEEPLPSISDATFSL